MTHRILVVEDNRSNTELLADWLEMQGYEVHIATDLRSAVAAVERHRPHAILLDIQLGTEDGLDLAAWLRQQPDLARTPVIAVTAHAMVTEQERMLQTGCNVCISKPIDFKLLREQLHRWLTPSDATQPES